MAPFSMLFRAGVVGITIATEIDDAVSLLQVGVAKHTQHGDCGEVPTICPEEGKAKTDECPVGCKYIESCDMCKKAAVFWKRAYGGANNWPNPPRPHGCFRNRKWKIKCNDKGPYGGFKGKWPVCQQICGHAKWVGTKWEKSCVKACPTTTTTTTVCAPGSQDTSDPCEIKSCADDGSGWNTATVDCAEDMGQPCVGGNYEPAPAGTCCSVCVTTTTTTVCAPGSTDTSDPCEIKSCADDGSGWNTATVDCAEDMGQPCTGGNYEPAPAGTCCSVCVTTTTTTTTKSYVTIATTSTPKQNPDPNSQCQGNPDCIIDEICANGTTTSFYIGNLKYNNLGGMGPRFGDPPVIHYRNVGALNSRSLDMIVTTDSRYKNANFNYRWRAGWWIMSGKQFIGKYNGVHTVPGAGVVGTLAPGQYQMTFSIVYSEDQTPAVIPYWPMTFYDLDGGKEHSGSCDATSAVLHRPTAVTGGCSGGCCKHHGAPYEVGTPTNWDGLTDAQKKASVTYMFKDTATAKFDYSTTYQHRIFLFKGSKVVACNR